jgi:hypothetical protein
MKIIDLLNKIANGEEVPKKIRIDHWCYNFEWVEYMSNYYDKREDIDLMSCLSMDKEELNCEVHELEEEKKIPEKITINDNGTIGFPNGEWTARNMDKAFAMKINSIIDYLKSKGE